MNEDEFVSQELSLGRAAHEHDGVWWLRSSIGVCKPLLPLLSFSVGKARPNPRKSLLMYSHMVDDAREANRLYPMMILREERLRAYEFAALRHAKRKAIRKAERVGCTVEKITDLRAVAHDLREIAISNAERVQYGHEASYYETHFEEWLQGLEKQFALSGREWWGAWIRGQLVAYLYFYQVGDTVVLDTTKTSSRAIADRPSDLLHFEVLRYCRSLGGCRRVYAGGSVPGEEGIDWFKEGHGFEKTAVPVHSWYNPLLRAARAVVLGTERIAGPALRQAAVLTPDSRPLELYRRIVESALRIQETKPSESGEGLTSGVPASEGDREGT